MSSTTFIMNLNVESLVRSAVVLVVGLPLTFSLGGLSRSVEGLVSDPFKAELKEPCLQWGYSKTDSKLERAAKDEIDEIMGGEVSYSDLCQYVLR